MQKEGHLLQKNPYFIKILFKLLFQAKKDLHYSNRTSAITLNTPNCNLCPILQPLFHTGSSPAPVYFDPNHHRSQKQKNQSSTQVRSIYDNKNPSIVDQKVEKRLKNTSKTTKKATF